MNLVDPTGHQAEKLPYWVGDDYHSEYNDPFYESWQLISYNKKVPQPSVTTERTLKNYIKYYTQTITKTWRYKYEKSVVFSKYPPIVKVVATHVDQFTDSQTYQWQDPISAEEIAKDNAKELASYGPPPNARVISHTTTLNGQPFSYDMIYGRTTQTAQYNVMQGQIAQQTEPVPPPEPKSFWDRITGHIEKAATSVTHVITSTARSVGSYTAQVGNQIYDYARQNGPTLLRWTHHGLDAVGLIPGIGWAGDLANVGIYALEGDTLNVGISLAAAVPLAGDAVTIGKYTYKGVKAAKEVETVVSDAGKLGKNGLKETPLKLEHPVAGDNVGVYLRPKSNLGRSGKQSRLKEIANDDKVSTALRGEIKRDINEIKLGKRKNIRVPQGYNLAHRRGYEARKGYGYKYSDLQTIRSHRTQHKHDGYGKRIK